MSSGTSPEHVTLVGADRISHEGPAEWGVCVALPAGRHHVKPASGQTFGQVYELADVLPVLVNDAAVLGGPMHLLITGCTAPKRSNTEAGTCNGCGMVTPSTNELVSGTLPVLRPGNRGRCRGMAVSNAKPHPLVPVYCDLEIEHSGQARAGAAGTERTQPDVRTNLAAHQFRFRVFWRLDHEEARAARDLWFVAVGDGGEAVTGRLDVAGEASFLLSSPNCVVYFPELRASELHSSSDVRPPTVGEGAALRTRTRLSRGDKSHIPGPDGPLRIELKSSGNARALRLDPTPQRVAAVFSNQASGGVVTIRKGHSLWKYFGRYWPIVYYDPANAEFRQANPNPDRVTPGSTLQLPARPYEFALPISPVVATGLPAGQFAKSSTRHTFWYGSCPLDTEIETEVSWAIMGNGISVQEDMSVGGRRVTFEARHGHSTASFRLDSDGRIIAKSGIGGAQSVVELSPTGSSAIGLSQGVCVADPPPAHVGDFLVKVQCLSVTPKHDLTGRWVVEAKQTVEVRADDSPELKVKIEGKFSVKIPFSPTDSWCAQASVPVRLPHPYEGTTPADHEIWVTIGWVALGGVALAAAILLLPEELAAAGASAAAFVVMGR
jgi:hypothetical protein